MASDSVNVVPSVFVPPGKGLLVAKPTAEDERAMEGMNLFERIRWMVEHRRIVIVNSLDAPASQETDDAK